MPRSSDRSPTFLSTFSGCGGFDAGFIEEGFECLGAFDIDEGALRVHESNLGVSVTQCDLSHGLPASASKLRPDVVLAGSPCQGFSTIGHRRLNDSRNHLLLEAGRIAVRLAPAVFIAENVAGVAAGAHGRYWRALTKILRTAGYATQELRVSAEDYGVPQRRRRLVMLAWRTGRSRTIQLAVRSGQTLRDALQNVNGLSDHVPRVLDPLSVSGMIARRIGQGQKLSDVRASERCVHTWHIPEVFGRTNEREREMLHLMMRLRRQNRTRAVGDGDPQTLTAIRSGFGHGADAVVASLVAKGYFRVVGRRFDLAHRFNGAYRRLHWDELSPTVDTRFGDPRLFLHPTEDRGLTVREAARIQGFDDSFVFAGSLRDKYAMIGNAVPPPLGAAIASAVRSQLL